MASTTFVSRVTRIAREWLQDVNDLVYGLPSSASASLGAALIARGAQVVDSVTALRGLSKTAASKYAYLTAYATAGDQGEIWYKRDDSDTTSSDNPGVVVVATDGGRWKAVHGSWLVNGAAFGIKADNGTTDNAARLLAAITYCQLTRRSLLLPSGGDNAIGLSTQLVLTGNPIGIYGNMGGPMQQGSTRPCTTLRWYGGATSMIDIQSSGWSFIGFAVDNFGSATDFCTNTTGSQHLTFDSLSFLIGSGASIFSRAILYSPINAYGYSRFLRIHCMGAAPKFLYVDGNGSSNGLTPIYFGQRCVFESNSASALTVVYLEDVQIDAIIIENNTFNQQDTTNQLTIIDTTASPRSLVATTICIKNNEWDYSVTATAAHRALRLTNCPNVEISSNQMQCGGNVTAWAELVNSTVTAFYSNYIERINGPVFNGDATSRVIPGKNELKVANTKGILNDLVGGVPNVATITYGTTVTLKGQDFPPDGVARLNVTDGVGWTLSLAHPGIGTGGYFVPNRIYGLQVRNVSGGAMGAITLVAGGYFKLAGGAFPAPANGNSRTVWMMWDGANLVEVNRTTADIPN